MSDHTHLLKWVIPDQLARSGRPGFPVPDVPEEQVNRWVAEMKDQGIRSIICLLHETQLDHWYQRLEEGLLERYKAHGFNVAHFNILDYKTPPMDPHQLPPIWEAYQELPKPVLIHCSLGRDRTGQAVEYILEQMQLFGGE